MRIVIKILLLLLLAGSGCKTTKHIIRERVKTDSTATSQLHLVHEATSKETVHDTVRTIQQELSNEISLDWLRFLLAGDSSNSTVLSDNPIAKTELKIDPKTGKGTISTTIKPQSIPVNKTIEKTDRTTVDNATAIQLHKDEAKKTVDKEKKGLWLSWWQWMLVIILLAGGFALFVWWKLKEAPVKALKNIV